VEDNPNNGGLAQLARAPALHAGGQRTGRPRLAVRVGSVILYHKENKFNKLGERV